MPFNNTHIQMIYHRPIIGFRFSSHSISFSFTNSISLPSHTKTCKQCNKWFFFQRRLYHFVCLCTCFFVLVSMLSWSRRTTKPWKCVAGATARGQCSIRQLTTSQRTTSRRPQEQATWVPRCTTSPTGEHVTALSLSRTALSCRSTSAQTRWPAVTRAIGSSGTARPGRPRKTSTLTCTVRLTGTISIKRNPSISLSSRWPMAVLRERSKSLTQVTNEEQNDDLESNQLLYIQDGYGEIQQTYMKTNIGEMKNRTI